MGNPRDFHRNPSSPSKSFSTCVRNTICCWLQASRRVPPIKTPRQNPILPKTEHANLICAAISCSFAEAERWRDGSLLTCLAPAGGGVLEPVDKLLRCWSHDKQREINKGLRKTCRLLDCGRKLEFPEKNPHRRARKMHSRHKKTTNPETSSDAKRPISRQ